ncbi:MAG TPA: CheR family methyltransferase [Thermotogota bacterium]|nr:CheR family methyltransferase [Thermotogota bacterium]
MPYKQQFTEKIYAEFTDYLSKRLGMECKMNKRQMLQSKIDSFMRMNEIDTYNDLLDFLKTNEDTEQWNSFVHKITTHKTDFFRENQHFSFLKDYLPTMAQRNRRILLNKEIRIWSAGCSSGEEPYTLAMFFRETFPDIYPKILATDISTESLLTAIKGIYPYTIKNELPPYYLSKYFKKDLNGFQINPGLKQFITFRSFNLTKNFKFKKDFDIIFCRNVMIYFSEPVRESLVNRFFHSLVASGIFIIGHSESLINLKQNFKYIKPTIYLK